ncbi:MAG: GNAT family N-acetyltransferase, partial [Thermoleophilia bacterium]|nr:GNAT family N-acetyltransferase [Thermoleophilia bacterium]
LAPADIDAMVHVSDRAYAQWSNNQGRMLFTADVKPGRDDAINLGLFTPGDHLIAMGRAIALAGPWHVVDVCTDPSWQGQGIARRMLSELLSELRRRGDTQGVTLEVRVTNERALALYLAAGFIDRGRRPGYYTDNKEDAVVMWRAPQAVIEAGLADGWEPTL